MRRQWKIAIAAVVIAQAFLAPRPRADGEAVLEVRLPQPWGELTPAVRTELFVDPQRPDELSDDPLDHRPILVRIWYPSDAVSGERRPYMPSAVAEAWRQKMPAVSGFEEGVVAHSLIGTPLSRAKQRWPVLLFSHGRSFPVENYQIALEHLSSSGWIVAAISHPYEETLTVLPDGRSLPFGGPTWQEEDQRGAVLSGVVDQLVRDATHVLDRLESLDREPTDPFFGRLDLAKGVGYLGHSLGGAAAAAALDHDARVMAAVSWEGQVYAEEERPLRLARPLLYVIGGANRAELAGQHYRPARGGGPVYELVIEGAWHASFGDMLHIYRAYADRAWLERRRREIDALRVNQISNDYIDQFFGHQLLGEEADLLWPDSTETSWGARDYPEAELRIYTSAVAPIAPAKSSRSAEPGE